MTPAQTQKMLYERDLVAWLDDTAIKLTQRLFNDIDVDSLIEEIESLAGRDRREVASRLEVLLSYLLKRLYVDLPNDHRGWELTIREQRRQLQLLLNQSPSLRNYLTEVFSEAWETVSVDLREDYPNISFPDEWEFSKDVDVLLSEKFWESKK
jgi:Domain of unknown function DUF29